jgi:hypothetical protein
MREANRIEEQGNSKPAAHNSAVNIVSDGRDPRFRKPVRNVRVKEQREQQPK